MTSSPSISVVIPTRDRPDDLQRCLESLTRVAYSRWNVLVVDQSDSARTREVADGFAAALPYLRYGHPGHTGLCRARNEGIAGTDGEVVAFLDDDCTVEEDWLQGIAHAFARYPGAALVFGTVEAAPHDPRVSFVIAHEIREERAVRGRAAALRLGGIGASMYLRRAAAERVGSFDPYLGAGSGHFSAADDDDYRYRALAAGYEVVETPSITVCHHGMRDYEGGAASRLLRGYAQSNGGLHIKLLRCGDPFALVLIARYARAYLRAVSLRNLVLRRGPSGAGQFALYLRGLAASFTLGVDRGRRVYKG